MLKSVKTLAITTVFCAAFVSQIAFSADDASMDEAAPAPAAEASEATEAPAAPMSAAAEEFGKLDANKDGMIDDKEAKSNKKLAKSFKKLAKTGKMDEATFTKWFDKKTAKPKG